MQDDLSTSTVVVVAYTSGEDEKVFAIADDRNEKDERRGYGFIR
jgi:hypothetical protein